MTKRFVTVLISLAIAVQSVMSFANVDQRKCCEAEYHDYSHGGVDSQKQNPADTPPQKNPDRSQQCHHGQGCCHVVLIGNLRAIPRLAMEMLSTDFQANFTIGVRSSLYRPPIS